MKSQIIEENQKKQTDMSRLLQEAVISLCQKNYAMTDVEIDGIICISFKNSFQQHVVKIHEKLKNENEMDSNSNHDEFNHNPPGLVVCDLTDDYNSPKSLDSVRNIYDDNGNKDVILRNKPASFMTGMRTNYSDTIATSVNSNSIMLGRKFSGGTKSKRKARTPSFIASAAKERQDDCHGNNSYGNDGERMQELLGSNEDKSVSSSNSSVEFKRTSFVKENMGDEEAFNSDFIVIKSEPTDEEENMADSLEEETSFHDQSRNEDEENSVSIIQDGADTMYIVKNEYGYQDESKECDQQMNNVDDDMKTEDFSCSGDSYNASFLPESLSSHSAQDVPYSPLYHSDKHSIMQTYNVADDENNFRIKSGSNNDQQYHTGVPVKSASKSFPHLKLKLSNPSRMLNSKNRQDSTFTTKSPRFSHSPQGFKNHNDTSSLSLRLKNEADEYARRRIYFCRYCGKGFTMKCTQMRHEKTICEGGGEASYKCEICEKYFTRSDSRLRHMIKTHKLNTIMNVNMNPPM